MKNITTLIFVFISIKFMFSQVNTVWTENTPGIREGRMIIIDNSDNIYFIDEAGGFLKMNPLGDTLWYKQNLHYAFKPAKSIFDHDHNILLLGTYKVNSVGDKNMMIIKIDTSGNDIWDLSIDTPNGNRETARSIDVDINNNIYITGYNGSQHFGYNYIAKISANGGFIWEKNDSTPYGGAGDDNSGVDIVVADLNSIYIVGNESRDGNTIDATIIKYDSTGNTIWKDVFSWNIWQNEYFHSGDIAKKIALDSLNNIYILTQSNNYGVILKYSSSGNRLWVTQVESTDWTKYHDLIVDSTGIYVSGFMNDVTTLDSYLTAAKLDFNGNVLWSTHDASTLCNGGYMAKHNSGVTIVGTTQFCNGCDNNYYTVHLDNSSGNILWTHTQNSYNGHHSDEAFDIEVDKYNGIYITGHGFGSSHIGYNYKIFDCLNIDSTLSIKDSSLFVEFNYNANYEWIDCSNNSIIYTSNSDNSFNPNYTGSFKVKTSIGSCSKISACISNLSLGMKFYNTIEFDMYPNPTKGNFTISLKNYEDKINLRVFDITGRVTFSKSYTNIKLIENNLSLATGSYIIELSNYTNKTYKVIIVE